MSELTPYLLGAILAAFLMFPAGYLARVALSRATKVPPARPVTAEILTLAEDLSKETEGCRKGLETQQTQIADLAHGIQLMKQEWTDFYEKTRKSEERNRKRIAAAGERDDDDEDLTETDQLLMSVMQQQAEQGAPAEDDLYARARRMRPRGQ